MINFVVRFGEDKRICAVSYLLPFISPSILLSTGWMLLPIGPSLLFLIAVLAPKASRLKFHAIQSIFLYSASLLSVVITYLFALYKAKSGIEPTTFLVQFGMRGVFLAVMLLAFLLLIGILFFKTWQGKTLQLPFLGEWALAVSEGDYRVLKWVGVLFLSLLFIYKIFQ